MWDWVYRYTYVSWMLLSLPLQTDSVLCPFWFPVGQGLGRPWHLHTNENNHGKYVNLPDCGWLRQTVLFQKGQMLLWVITYGNWIHLTITIMAQYLTHECDVLHTLHSFEENDTVYGFSCHLVTELREFCSVYKTAFLIKLGTRIYIYIYKKDD